MKRIACLLLSLCLLLSGCSGERIKDPVTFYYPRQEYQYGTADGVIASELREASGHTGDLRYLLALYLIGPSSEDLVSPLPRGTRLLQARQEGSAVTLELTDTAQAMTDAEFTLACACLTMTCLSVTGAEKVTITSGSRCVTMSPDSLTLFDDSTAASTTEETQ
ncbi:MAG: GerMN domain-containing protein [Faecousia sp.]